MQQEELHKASPLLVVQSTDFPTIFRLYEKLKRVKAFLDEIAEEFIDAKSVRMVKLGNEYQVVVEYESYEFNRLSKILVDTNPLSNQQKGHMAKELSEILINLSSHSGSRIINCTALEPACFVFDTQTGWNDAKIDLFYLTVVSNMDINLVNIDE